MSENRVKRSEKLLFYGVKDAGGQTVFHRATGFTDLTVKRAPETYARRYVDEDAERSDVTGYQTVVSFSFDYYRGNAVHDDMIALGRMETLGEDALREILLVDTATQTASRRSFSVTVESEGAGGEGFVCGGTFRAVGPARYGSATTTDLWQTCGFMYANEA
jgi:hypothetical protein